MDESGLGQGERSESAPTRLWPDMTPEEKQAELSNFHSVFREISEKAGFTDPKIKDEVIKNWMSLVKTFLDGAIDMKPATIIKAKQGGMIIPPQPRR